MTWKRCSGCTRAISSAALTCEYCGHFCDEVMDGLQVEGGDRTKLAWPPEDPQADSAASPIDDDSPQGLPALELKSSFPFTETDGSGPQGPLSDLAFTEETSA